MKDIVIGSITNYSWDKIKYWVNSLDRSGFSGLKVMLCYNIDFEVAEELSKRNYTVFAFGKDEETNKLTYNREGFNICLERFAHIPYFLNRLSDKEDYRYIIATDVKDVIFQSNPSEWLEKNIGDKELNVGSECIRYKDEPWGRQNMHLSFGPLFYEMMKDKEIFNAGTISGKFQTFLDFCNVLFLMCGGAPSHVPGGGGPDQAALNILLNMKPYKDVTNFCKMESGYAVQAGTTADPSRMDVYGPANLEKPPQMINDTVCTHEGKPVCIVHQYDRNPEWKKIIEAKYA